ncbi:hypothetical protein [Methylotuvimicrobium sp. KM2]|uniref:hypothetical protein n=1 Tax=Methylotuvimicrobium sp. KM2 TaxID=3133976 RepID=UPI003100B2C9
MMKQQEEYATKKDASVFWKAFFEVLSGTSLYASQGHINLEQRGDAMNKMSDLERLRGDWQKIGADFRVSINKAKQTTERF